MSWNKTHSKALEEKVARLKNANHRIREELKQCYKKIAELEEAMKHKTCKCCLFAKITISSVICGKNGTYKEVDDYCKYHKPKDTQ